MKVKKNKILKIILLSISFPEISFGFCGYYGFGGSKTLVTGVATTSTELTVAIIQLINNLIEFITKCLVTPALILVIVVSGVYIMISLGNPARVELGKRVLLAGIIGLIIIFAAGEAAEFFGKYIR
jgi:hypothetical protein